MYMLILVSKMFFNILQTKNQWKKQLIVHPLCSAYDSLNCLCYEKEFPKLRDRQPY